MPSVFGGTIHSQVFVSLALLASVFSSASSATIIALIRKMGIWNLHVSLIFAMTVFELMYDVTFFSGMVNTGSFEISVFSNIAQLLGGTTSSIISNVIAGVALYVVFYKRTIDVQRYYVLVISICSVPGLVIAILYITALSEEKYKYLANVSVLGIYYFVRLVSIGINFVCSICTAWLIRRMKSQSTTKTASEVAISTMSIRLLYYPLVQAVGRTGCAWYEMQYGYNFSRDSGFNFNPSYTNDEQFAAQCLMVICTPLISIGYLTIFLIMQPDAWVKLQQYLALLNLPVPVHNLCAHLLCCCCCCWLSEAVKDARAPLLDDSSYHHAGGGGSGWSGGDGEEGRDGSRSGATGSSRDQQLSTSSIPSGAIHRLQSFASAAQPAGGARLSSTSRGTGAGIGASAASLALFSPQSATSPDAYGAAALAAVPGGIVGGYGEGYVGGGFERYSETSSISTQSQAADYRQAAGGHGANSNTNTNAGFWAGAGAGAAVGTGRRGGPFGSGSGYADESRDRGWGPGQGQGQGGSQMSSRMPSSDMLGNEHGDGIFDGADMESHTNSKHSTNLFDLQY
jgi:hypothetical protein